MLGILSLLWQLIAGAFLLAVVAGLIANKVRDYLDYRSAREYDMHDPEDTLVLPAASDVVVLREEVAGHLTVQYHRPHPNGYGGSVEIAVGEHTRIVVESVEALQFLHERLAALRDRWSTDLGDAPAPSGRHARTAGNGYPDPHELHIASLMPGAGAIA
ncbi:hypothetical protein [Nocardia cyriacigeorgica]|uniref:hypothetical protein n=1 Tax=Nocardia cyriacigeorgica TaxID=135487 RepID=UPI00148753D6|nr:hypothetical protein [Nocardia cyriacigeorgica]